MQKKKYSWNPAKCIFDKSKYLRIIADNSFIECNEIIIAMDIVSRKKTNIWQQMLQVLLRYIAMVKKVRHYYISLRVLLVVNLLLMMIIIISCYYAKQKGLIQDGK